jgi:hypothetical protein
MHAALIKPMVSELVMQLYGLVFLVLLSNASD